MIRVYDVKDNIVNKFFLYKAVYLGGILYFPFGINYHKIPIVIDFTFIYTNLQLTVYFVIPTYSYELAK